MLLQNQFTKCASIWFKSVLFHINTVYHEQISFWFGLIGHVRKGDYWMMRTINGSSSARAILTKLKHSYLHNCFICKWHWNEWKIKTRHILIDSILGLCTLHSLKQNKIHLKIVKWVILVAKMTSNIENNAKIYKFTISISRQFAFELFAYWQVVVIVVVVVVGFFCCQMNKLVVTINWLWSHFAMHTPKK